MHYAKDEASGMPKKKPLILHTPFGCIRRVQ
jgi:hypothetical protein